MRLGCDYEAHTESLCRSSPQSRSISFSYENLLINGAP